MKVMAGALVRVVVAVGLTWASTQAESTELLLPCSDPVFQVAYAHVVELVAACETESSVRLEYPLTISQVQTICSTCTTLAEQTKLKQLPECETDKRIDAAGFAAVSAQTFYEELFACSGVNATASKVSAVQRALVVEAGSSTGDVPTPTPLPVTVIPTPTTAPVTVTPPPIWTPASSDTMAPSPSPSDSESSTAPVPSATENPPTPTTPSSTTQTSGSQSGSNVPLADGIEDSGTKALNVKMIAGFAAGIVLLVILLATFVVCRHRQRSESKLTETLLSPQTTQRGSSVPRQSTRNTTDRSTGAGASGIRTGGESLISNLSSQHQSQQQQQGGLWEDEAIIAVRIPREKVVASMLLSRGGYGEVYRGMYNDQQVAIKTLLPETRKNFKQINALLAEVKLMAELEHERIVQFLGVAWDSLTDLCVVAEFMEGGDLRATLNRFEDIEHRPHGFDHDKIKIALHISHALTYLHSLQPVVLHRDLKSKNILLDSELNAKLTDFGVSRERVDRTMTAGVGTSLWMAPEVMLGERYDGKADVFSFGVVLSELDSHVLPYSHVVDSNSGHRIPDTAVLQMVSLGRLRVEFSPRALPEMVELAYSCVALRPQDRPTAAEVLYRLNSILKRT